MNIIDLDWLESVSPWFRGEKGRSRAKRILHMLKVDKVEESYDEVSGLEGIEAATRWLQNQDVRCEIHGRENLEHLPEGAFITISNHSIGTVDGIMLLSLIGEYRPDYKMLVNQILGRFKCLESAFIQVTPTGEERKAPTAESIKGIRQALEHLSDGHPLGLFPSGAVSDLHPGKRPVVQMPDGTSYREPRIRDREWQMPMIRFIAKAGVPVVPIRNFDGNSRFFFDLGLISWKIRVLRQPAEVMNKSGKTLRFGVGEVIQPERIAACKDLEELRTLLRGSVYGMKL